MNNAEVPSSNFLFRSIRRERATESNVQNWRFSKMHMFTARRMTLALSSRTEGSQVYEKISSWLRNQFCTQSFRIKTICFYLCRPFPVPCVRPHRFLLSDRPAIWLFRSWAPTRLQIGSDKRTEVNVKKLGELVSCFVCVFFQSKKKWEGYAGNATLNHARREKRMHRKVIWYRIVRSDSAIHEGNFPHFMLWMWFFPNLNSLHVTHQS